jgi:hypothetical protein
MKDANYLGYLGIEQSGESVATYQVKAVLIRYKKRFKTVSLVICLPPPSVSNYVN